MNKGDLINKVAVDANMSKNQASEILNVVFDSITETLMDGDKVSLVGFGTFTLNERKARTGRNPQTGASIQIPSKNIVKFKPGKDLSERVN